MIELLFNIIENENKINLLYAMWYAKQGDKLIKAFSPYQMHKYEAMLQ